MTILLKFIHLAAIAIWSGGLIVLPFLFWQRRGLISSTEVDRLHRITRLVYVELTSPAAFVAIASGTALIFLQATFVEWFTAKMVLVGIMAMLHVLAGLVLHDLYLPNGRFSRGSGIVLTIAYIVVIVGIIWIVLAKPTIDSNMFAPHLFEPGGLGRWLHHSFGETRMPTP
ncbi:CopD family protein [Paraburkholderia sp. ZP32-5]|uniref:CopD family protein n=1 Tax=Paraburkholderia sp. ZP32-5 TaxID=2883245 RepID=UPI001F1C0FB5|nr:CopD family protein [Paraburkholderia sp. ZP32-5]